MTNPFYYLSATMGMIKITWPSGAEETFSLEDAASMLIEEGVTSWMNSSSMDFGDEYGFDEPDVRRLLAEEMLRQKPELAKGGSA